MPTLDREAGLLSRVADALYWIGRYLERAEHSARLLDVHTGMALEAVATDAEWAQLADLTRDGGEYPANWPVDATWVSRFVVHYPGNPNAIVACLTVARENARGVRGAISSELWEQINGLYDEVSGNSGDRLFSPGLVLGSATVVGAVNIVLFTALATIGAFVYNICSDLVGGIEVTLAERD